MNTTTVSDTANYQYDKYVALFDTAKYQCTENAQECTLLLKGTSTIIILELKLSCNTSIATTATAPNNQKHILYFTILTKGTYPPTDNSNCHFLITNIPD